MTATPFKPVKPRTPGSLHHALTRAINEVGGLSTAADLIQRQENWVYKAADPDVDERRKATLFYEEARTLTRSAATALAEDLSLIAGGFFLPPVANTAPQALQIAVASYAMESGDALAEIDLLSAALYDQEASSLAFERLAADHFREPVHARVWGAMARLRKQGLRVEPSVAVVGHQLGDDEGFFQWGWVRGLIVVLDKGSPSGVPGFVWSSATSTRDGGWMRSLATS